MLQETHELRSIQFLNNINSPSNKTDRSCSSTSTHVQNNKSHTFPQISYIDLRRTIVPLESGRTNRIDNQYFHLQVTGGVCSMESQQVIMNYQVTMNYFDWVLGLVLKVFLRFRRMKYSSSSIINRQRWEVGNTATV